MHLDCRDETGSQRSSRCDPDTDKNDTSDIGSLANDGSKSESSTNARPTVLKVLIRFERIFAVLQV